MIKCKIFINSLKFNQNWFTICISSAGQISWPTGSDHLEMQMLLMQKQKLTTHSGFFAPCSLSTTHWYKLILLGTSLEAWLGWAIKPGHKTHDTGEAVRESFTQCCSCMSHLHVYTYWMRWREWLPWSCELFKSKNMKLSPSWQFPNNFT